MSDWGECRIREVSDWGECRIREVSDWGECRIREVSDWGECRIREVSLYVVITSPSNLLTPLPPLNSVSQLGCVVRICCTVCLSKS